MQSLVPWLRQSASIRVFTIGALILVLLIPLAMIKGVIHERDETGQAAKFELMRVWGDEQLVAGPILVLPYKTIEVTKHGKVFEDQSYVVFLPSTLTIEATVDSEIRYRGLHKVPVYSSEVRFTGTFAPPDLDGLGIDVTRIESQGAFVALGVSDGSAITKTPTLNINGHTATFVPAGEQINSLPPQIIAPLGAMLEEEGQQEKMRFEVTLNINGTDTLRFLPLGDTTNASMRSAWQNPSFIGSYLPESREIAAAGFEANWKISSIGRPLPSRWIAGSPAAKSAESSAFGVSLYMPISAYRQTLRATKYAVLFIGLTFVAYFLFEVVADLRLHPLQYLLVGFANSLFYLLLLSLAEHIGFGWSYTISAAASCGLIVGYSNSVLGSRQRATIMAVILILLYSFLYMTLKAESYAMLAGAIGLWLSLAIIMYLTRRIDWYAKSDPDENSG